MTTEPSITDLVLRCRECGRDAPAVGPQYCEWCFGPVEVMLPAPPDDRADLVAAVASGPPSLARYGPLLPDGLALADSDAGWTPLLAAPSLGAAVGLDNLFIKDETANPTGSFKDRVVDVAVARGVALGQRVIACSSTGNLARAVAGAAQRRGMRSVLLVPEGLDPADVADLARRGATVVAVRGGYDAASRLSADAASDLDQWAWVNVTLRPWYELGARTAGWEITEQLGWTTPDRIVAPVASGALVRALHESVAHLLDVGVAEGELPKVTALQPAGCAPVAEAFESGRGDVLPIRNPHTIAESLAMGDPPDGAAVIAAARATGGVVHAVAEDAISEAVALVASTEGIDVEPAGGVVVAGLAGLVAKGVIDPDERVVIVLTGRALAVSTAHQASDVVPGDGLAGTIEPSVSALAELLPPELLG